MNNIVLFIFVNCVMNLCFRVWKLWLDGGCGGNNKMISDNIMKDFVLCGCVKWFDFVKGFGFVIVEEGGLDILFYVNVLWNFG